MGGEEGNQNEWFSMTEIMSVIRYCKCERTNINIQYTQIHLHKNTHYQSGESIVLVGINKSCGEYRGFTVIQISHYHNYDFCGCWLNKNAGQGFKSFRKSLENAGTAWHYMHGRTSTYWSEIIAVYWLAVVPWEFHWTQGTCSIGHIKTLPWTCSKEPAKQRSTFSSIQINGEW